MWWHLNEDVAITSEWATPAMIENGLNPEDLLGKRFGHHLDFWSLSEGRLLQRVDLGDEHQMVLELRPAHDPRKTWGFLFLAGLVAAGIDLCSGIGAEADTRLSAHMLEHMIIWVIVAPLLAAGAPVTLAFRALPRAGRRQLARCLRSRPVAALTRPAGSASLFSAVILVTHIPGVYGLALTNPYVHATEHALYLFTALLIWAPLIGVDPLPHRPGPRGRLGCMLACILPMVLIALWLASAPDPVYGHYLAGLGPRALGDQRLAATIMWIGGLPAFAIPALARVRPPRRRPRRPARAQRATA